MLGSAQEGATLLVNCARTLKGQGTFPCAWYAKAIASSIHLANISLETAFPFYCPPLQIESCLDYLCGPSKYAGLLLNTETMRFPLWQPHILLEWRGTADPPTSLAGRNALSEQTQLQSIGPPRRGVTTE